MRRNPSSSTQASGVDNLPTTPRLSALRQAARARRVRDGEFKPGELLPGTRYRVVGLIGAGGMGLVYDVEHIELGKRFVLKALLSDLAGREDIVARLRNEQRALGRLQHPNIIAVTDAGVTSTNLPFFVMERLEGETLGARLKRSGTLPVVEAIAIARGVLEGLSAAHEIGVVHRDIKPQNIFLSSGGTPKILDFGVAKIADGASVITARGVAIGTPRYMSPEQVGGERIDGRSDLYAVGLLLFEAIVGKGPFDDARDANEMLVAHFRKPAPRLGSVAAGVARELDALVASLLAKSPGDRPPTARAANAALVAVLDRATPLASFTSTTQPLLVPGTGLRALATRPDGVAARHPSTVIDPKTKNPTTEVIPDTTFDRGASFGRARAPGGTLYDPSSRAVTVARPNVVVPPDAFRTERLGIAAFSPPSGDDVTHTRVPATPSDGTPSLAPVRVEAPSPQRGRPVALWVVAAALVVLVGGGYLVARGGTSRGESAPAAEPPRPVAHVERSEVPTAAAAPNAAVAPSAPPVPTVTREPASPSAPVLPSPKPPSSGERSSSSQKPTSTAPPLARPIPSQGHEISPANPPPKASGGTLPPRLPGSGL